MLLICINSVCAAGVCISLWQRRPGRDRSVLQEGHLDQTFPDLPWLPEAPSERHAWNPAEEGWGQCLPFLFWGMWENTSSYKWDVYFCAKINKWLTFVPLGSKQPAMLSVSAACSRGQGEGKSLVNLLTPVTFTVKRNASCYLSWWEVMLNATNGFICAFQPCGVDFEVKTYLANEQSNPDEKIEKKWVSFESSSLPCCICIISLPCQHISTLLHLLTVSPPLNRDTARLVIRKIQFAPSKVGNGPKAEICKSFMMSDKPVHLEASMDKDVQLQIFTMKSF